MYAPHNLRYPEKNEKLLYEDGRKHSRLYLLEMPFVCSFCNMSYTRDVVCNDQVENVHLRRAVGGLFHLLSPKVESLARFFSLCCLDLSIH